MADRRKTARRFAELALQAADPEQTELTDGQWAELNRLQDDLLGKAPTFKQGDRVRVVGGDECPECAEQLAAARNLVANRFCQNAEPFSGTVVEVFSKRRRHRRPDHKYLVQLDDHMGSWGFAAYELERVEHEVKES